MATARRAVTTRRTRSAARPPEGTPPPAELARQAREVLADAVRIARWAAVERDPGPVPLAAPARDRAAAALRMTPLQVRAGWDRARLAGLVELHGGTARPGWRLRAWDRDDMAVLRGWVALFDAWSLAHPAPTEVPPTAVAEVVEAVPQLLSLLQLSAGPVLVPALLDLLEQRVQELREERCEVPYGPGHRPAAGGPGGTPQSPQSSSEPVPDGGTPPGQDTAPRPGGEGGAPVLHGLPSVSPLLDWALDGLAAVGALTLDKGRSATLTPLGNWAVWVKLEQICVAAQSPAGNIEQSAEDMLRGCARLTPGPARAEYRAWLAARPVSSAVTELLTVARGEDALLRGLAFEALRVVGAPAEAEVRSAAAEASLRPYALLWLAEYEGMDPEDAPDVLSREDATWLWVDTAAAVADHGEPQLLLRHLDSAVQGTVPALLEEVRSGGHPRTVQVLVALAAAHPDPALAKAVRRAAFQVHTGGA
ncbi:hypothetical protein I3J09_23030 [Streptomyces clavuligerus]|nr:hypothetical protein [Streptomyces clavuligerus]QPL66747.1 hypothetical protein I3J04_23015 [Streptomyces clavuligerus]QPL72776.1 hypothetical protein I3J05_23025 [Streptomyces clavuligerus]QPL78854.1 hypothetical protein I3J06_23030 [Streptomyces clavuligerus]QPL84881.1 hypothetical protein I3J07_23065 [Streptomyces clavuligerus]